MSAGKAATASPILAMHARYEAAWVEYNRIDDAVCALRGVDPPSAEWGIVHRLEQGSTKLSREQMALTVAISQQVPTTWQEAVVLAFHLHTIDPVETNISEDEKAAFTVGFDTLLDFMFSEVDHGGVPGSAKPGQLNNVEHLLRDRRRMRRAQLEEAA